MVGFVLLEVEATRMAAAVARRFPVTTLRFNPTLLIAVCALLVCAGGATSRPAFAQETNPVDRQVTNPLTDTPNVNPLTHEQPLLPRRRRGGPEGLAQQPTDEFIVNADKQTVTGPDKARVVVYEGNVDARVGIYRLQADKLTVYEATNKVIAEGSVVFDQGEQQRITGTRAEWNYATKLGFFLNSTGFTNQSNDGTVMYFTADRVERIAQNKFV
ncbi:MAG TPA: LptA/OstA family protein, partial [Pyrinomonadaceae bacterium]|nr:LptA/OstA family protein [Pyrinomonadaceae bacterium]